MIDILSDLLKNSEYAREIGRREVEHMFDLLCEPGEENNRNRNSVKLGENFKGAFPIVLSPMASYTRYPFRQLCLLLGADMVITELISCRSYLEDTKRNNLFKSKTGALTFTKKWEKPVGFQLFGGDAEALAEAAKAVEKTKNYHFVDLNLGCPKRKIAKKGSGAILLKEPLEKLEEILNSLTGAMDLPLSIKIRLGWKRPNDSTSAVVKLAEKYDVWMIGIHGRYADDNYGIPANKRRIAEISRSTHIPILGNGDVFFTKDIEEYRELKCDGIMIGRGAVSNPFLFTKKDKPELIQTIAFLKLLCLLSEYVPARSFEPLKKISIGMLTGFRGAKELRVQFGTMESYRECYAFLERLEDRLV